MACRLFITLTDVNLLPIASLGMKVSKPSKLWWQELEIRSWPLGKDTKKHLEGKLQKRLFSKLKKKVLHIGVVPIVPYRYYVIFHEKVASYVYFHCLMEHTKI